MAMAAMAAIALEVTPNDWAAVLLRDEFDAGSWSGFGTVACAGAMLIGRLGELPQGGLADDAGARAVEHQAARIDGIEDDGSPVRDFGDQPHRFVNP